MVAAGKIISVVFFKSDTGKMPVRDWLLELSPADRKIIGEDIKTVEFGWPVGMPTSRSLGDGLYEVRSNLTGKRIARVLFMIYRNQMILLHGFIKKTQKTPLNEIRTARRRMKKFSPGQ